ILVTIVPDSVLTNRNVHQQIREHIGRTCEILSVISLPPVTFAAAGTTTKTSILHIKKKEEKGNQKTDTYFAVCEKIGYEVITRGAQRRKVFGGENDLQRLLSDKVADSREHKFVRTIMFDPTEDRWDAKFKIGNVEKLVGVTVSSLAS
ncbi:N-6 DNA methylase, partial [Pseudomonas sp. SB113]|uniref:N-6 DNA methylase n=1 Tax=Pseudomonas sp. SB113 TaxID=3154123 RepID=UPI00345D227B